MSTTPAPLSVHCTQQQCNSRSVVLWVVLCVVCTCLLSVRTMCIRWSCRLICRHASCRHLSIERSICSFQLNRRPSGSASGSSRVRARARCSPESDKLPWRRAFCRLLSLRRSRCTQERRSCRHRHAFCSTRTLSQMMDTLHICTPASSGRPPFDGTSTWKGWPGQGEPRCRRTWWMKLRRWV